MNTDLTKTQSDYAYFLPATSSYYATYIGKQRHNPTYTDPARVPKSFANGVDSLDYLDPAKGAFYFDHCLYSAGHAKLDLNDSSPHDDMFRSRNRATSWVLGDSGGYQIAKGVWPADWKDPTCPNADKKRKQVLNWMDTLMDYGMGLDIPAWLVHDPAARKATGINTYTDAVNATYINNDWFVNYRNGNCKFLNVLQGNNHSEANDWYSRMKKYCDPKQYGDRAFNGWAMGGQSMSDAHLLLRRLVEMRHDGLLEKGQQDWMHLLGTSKLEWAVMLTDIQRAIRKHHNESFTLSFDCASPFLAAANGQVYTHTSIVDRDRWSYVMQKAIDDKKYSTDTRLYKDVAIQDNFYPIFESSPIIDQCTINDICTYAPGDLNKLKKEGKNSWDGFSYAILQGHNVYRHIDAVQEANRQYDAGLYPALLVASKFHKKRLRQYRHDYCRDIINEIFATSDRDKSYALVDEYASYWSQVLGNRGHKLNSAHMFSVHFDIDEPDTDDIDDAVLTAMEDEVFNEDAAPLLNIDVNESVD